VTPPFPRPALRRALLLLLGAVLAAVGVARGQSPPLRVGVLHPHPRFCAPDGERAQKDLRLLRLVYGIAGDPEARARLPWFLASAEPGRDALALRTRALWGLPGAWLVHGQPDFPAPRHRDLLAPWRARVLAAVPGLLPGEMLSRHPFRLPDGADPFLPSRLNGSGLLPVRDDPPPGCPQWPAGVTYAPQADPYRYRFTRAEGPAGPALDVRGYATPGGLRYDLERGRVHVALLEAQDLARLGPGFVAGSGLRWGWQVGGQQVVLRLPAALAEALGPEGRRALSQAVPRPALAALGTPGRFRAARAFLEPLLPEPGAPAAPLGWDARAARGTWLARERALPRLRLEVLAHPWLQAMATRIAQQWQRTLNLTAGAVALDAEVFAARAGPGAPALRLEVVDLDDGSLQDLWLEHEPPRPAADLAGCEADFQARVPYLPLLANLHFAVAVGAEAGTRLAQVCPGCTVAAPGAAPPGVVTAAARAEPGSGAY